MKFLPRHTWLFFMSLTITACGQNESTGSNKSSSMNNPHYSRIDTTQLTVKNEEWRQLLPPELYLVAREQHTERAFTGKYYEQETNGTYYCAVCGNALFRSDSKFHSGCGWPSFFETIRVGAANYIVDRSHGMVRTEVTCGRCDSHLGHIFDDGPAPTFKRYCMNSVSLDFEPELNPSAK